MTTTIPTMATISFINESETAIDVKSANGSLNKMLTLSPEEVRDWFVLALYLITAILAIVGNIFVCLVVYNKKSLRSTTYKLMVNMAISDIMGGLLIPSQWLFCSTYLLDSGLTAQRFCGLSKSGQILSYYVSTFTMTVIAVERYRLICRPLSGQMSSMVPIIVIWLLGSLFTSTTFFSMRVSEYFSPVQGVIGCRVLFQSKVTLTLRKLRVLMVIITQYLIPLSLIAFFYAMVVRAVWQRQRIGNASNDKKKSFDENKKRMIKMLIVVTALFGLAWLPTHVMHYLKFFTKWIPVQKGTCNATTFYMLCYWLGISTCFFNPFIYCYFNNDFKGEAIRYWNKILPCLVISNKDIKSEETSATNATSSSNDYVTTKV